MVKIIKAQPVPKEQIECENCGSILEYENVDLELHQGYMTGSKYRFRCPVCGVYIDAKWIDVKDRLPEKDTHVLCVIADTDGAIHTEIRWRTIYDDVIVDNQGFAIYPPIEQEVLAWLPIPSYYKIKQ